MIFIDFDYFYPEKNEPHPPHDYQTLKHWSILGKSERYVFIMMLTLLYCLGARDPFFWIQEQTPVVYETIILPKSIPHIEIDPVPIIIGIQSKGTGGDGKEMGILCKNPTDKACSDLGWLRSSVVRTTTESIRVSGSIPAWAKCFSGN